MKNHCEEAKNFYSMSGRPGNVETQICRTMSGNYIYRHFLAGNSPQASRIYCPQTGEDLFLKNAGYFNYITAFNPFDIQEGFLLGKEVETNYGKLKKILPTIGNFIR